MAVYPASASGADDVLRDLLMHWGVRYAHERRDIALAGSPERCLARHVVQDADGRLYVLEGVPRGRSRVRARIAEALACLSDQGLARINPYLRGSGGAFLLRDGDRLWQLAPYVAGCPLDRPEYVHEGWRGEALARFLLDLRHHAAHVPAFSNTDLFDLPRFVRHLKVRLGSNEPALLERLGPSLQVLEERLLPSVDALPTAFCHGDVHAMNVIWAQDDIAAVIDWEFAGFKTEAYDLAVLLGCVGIEDPSGLQGSLVQRLLGALKGNAYVSGLSWALLPELVLANRLIWLSEWLRIRDAEMIELELCYIELLLANLCALRCSWGIHCA